MKKITLLLSFLFLTVILNIDIHAQTLAGSTVTLVETTESAIVNDTDASIPGEFNLGNTNFDIDGNQIIYSIRNGGSIAIPINFTFAGGTVTGITSITLNSGASTVGDTSGVTASVAGSGIGVTIDVSSVSNTSSINQQVVFDLVVTGASPNSDPTISIANTTLNYTEGNTATQIDGSATVNDSDGDWNGGTLVAQITANAEAADEISISDTDGDGTIITVSGTNILSNGIDIGDLSVSGGTVTNGTALTITFDSDATNANVQEVLQSLRYRNTSNNPGTSNRTVTVTATDANSGNANDTRTISVTAIPDITSVSIPNAAANVGDAITVTIIAGESGLSLNTGQVNGVTVTGFTNTSGNTYTATYTVAEGNTDRAAGDNIPVNFILADVGGNNSAAFTTAIAQASDPIDANSPSVTSVSIPNATANVGDAITVTITGSEAGLSLNTGQVNGVNVTGFSDDGGGSYSATYTVVEGNTDRAAGDDIPINFILSDVAGNNSAAFTTPISQASDPIDANSPSVTSVSIPNATANVGDAITVTVTASEAGLSLNTGQVNGVTVTGFSDDGGGSYSATYTVVEGNTDRAAGDDIPVNFILSDVAGNNSASFTTAISQAADPIDANSPSVTSVSIPNATANVGDAITVTVTASEAGLSLNTGQVNGVTVTGFSDDGGGSYSATYTVAEGNTDRAAGDDIPVNFILSDAAGNNSAAFTTAISQNADAIDANAPTITSVSIPNAAANVGDAITVTVTASEAGLSLNTGQVNGVTVTGFSDDGGGSYSATYTVIEGNTDRAAGDNIPVNFILSDASGNNSASFTTAISQAADPIDANTPAVVSVTVPANATYVTGNNLDFTVNFNENITVVTTSGTPQIAITIGVTVRQAAYISGSGSSALLFRYTVQAADLDTDGIAVDALADNGGTLRDIGNNNATLTLNSVGNTASVLVGNPTVTWTGITNNNWNTASNWNTNTVPVASSNVTVPNSLTNYPTISSAVIVNSIAIASGASLIANATVTGQTTYTRNLPTTNWYLVAAPLSGETQEDIITGHTFATGSGSNIGIGAFVNNGTNPWIYATNATTGPLVSGTGVSMKLAIAGNVSITGSINTSNVNFPIATGTRNNFNLIGNPFTSFVSSSTFAFQNTGLLSEETVWLWNGSQYVTYNAVSPIQIAPAQGFFVEASNTGNVIFSTANQSHLGADTFMRSTPKPMFELFVEEGSHKKSTKIFFVDGKTTGFDNGYDSKMFSGITENFAVFTQLVANDNGNKLAIQSLPNSNLEEMIIPVGLTAKSGKEITFSISSKNLPNGINIYIEDRVNNTFVNLSKGSNTVTLQNDIKAIGRFYLHTTSKNLKSINVKQTLENISIYKSSENTLTIAGLRTEKASLNVYSILGKKVMNTQFNSTGAHVIKLPKIAAGVYIIELNSELGKINKKIILE